ncbi:MAG TPA: redox-regulated ATPase YchF [Acidimicrobiales bacterium]|nr:redox-regulated ATPase YchF [Acidimicrobiales bacterium]
MGLSIGIVGLPNVGKSTLFNALTGSHVLAANYPFATIDPNQGVVPVPDPRLRQLAELFDSQEIVPATVTFVDIAGLVEGASRGEGLGNRFLAAIRETDAICQVVRVFEDDDVVHTSGRIDPAGDISIVNAELALADLQTLEGAIPRLEKEARKRPDLAAVVGAATAARQVLDDDGTVFAAAGRGELDAGQLGELHLLTAKPFLYVFNVSEDSLGDGELAGRLAALVAPAESLVLCAQLEAELAALAPEEAAELLTSYGLEESGLARLAKVGFATLGLQTFLTAGPKEARAWTIRAGDTAPRAAGTIHTDFERGFVKAEVVSYDDLVAAGSLSAVRAAGKARMEGKDYVMREGDVVEFRFNV